MLFTRKSRWKRRVSFSTKAALFFVAAGAAAFSYDYFFCEMEALKATQNYFKNVPLFNFLIKDGVLDKEVDLIPMSRNNVVLKGKKRQHEEDISNLYYCMVPVALSILAVAGCLLRFVCSRSNFKSIAIVPAMLRGHSNGSVAGGDDMEKGQAPVKLSPKSE